jgi:HAD superfamily hydrolase (TIGR01459 family)
MSTEEWHIEGIGQIAARFGGMLIDQFGVIHDGERLYPGTLQVLRELNSLGIPVAVMTNSGKRAAANVERIVRMGVPREWFVDAVSSGEVAHERVRGSKAYLIGKRGEDYGFGGVTFVGDVRDAEIVLILGSNAPETSLDEYRRFFEGVEIPAVCCNPDKLMLTAKGLQPAPGAIAAIYEEMGGKVTWIGKPHADIYAHALKLIGNPPRCLCIGDSAEHDVAGGRNAGLSTLLVLQGVSEGLAEEGLSPRPDFVAEAFRW